MKLSIDSGEAFPHLFISEPKSNYEHEHAFDVPDDLAQAVLTAQAQLHAAEQALLVWLRDIAGLSSQSDIIDHLDDDEPVAGLKEMT